MKNVPIDAKIVSATDEILGRPQEFIKGNMKKRKTKRFRIYDGIQAKELAIEIDITRSNFASKLKFLSRLHKSENPAIAKSNFFFGI